MQISFGLSALFFFLGRKRRQSFRMLTYFVERTDSRLMCAFRGLTNEVAGEFVQHASKSSGQQKLAGRIRMLLLHTRMSAIEDGDVISNILKFQNSGFQAIVDVSGKIGNLVGKVDQLRLKRRPQVEKVLMQFRVLSGLVVARVFDDTLSRTEREV